MKPYNLHINFCTFVVLSDVLLDGGLSIESEHVPEVIRSLREDENNHAETPDSQADYDYLPDAYLFLLGLLLRSQLFVSVIGGKSVHLCDLILCWIVLTVDLHNILYK